MFDYKLTALVKSFVMFIGELDFSGMAINPVFHANDWGAILAYSFVIMYIFMVVIVLMNLLNGIAIQDTSEITAQSAVLLECSKLEILEYFERTIGSKLNVIEVMRKRLTQKPKEGWSLPQEIALFYEHSIE